MILARHLPDADDLRDLVVEADDSRCDLSEYSCFVHCRVGK